MIHLIDFREYKGNNDSLVSVLYALDITLLLVDACGLGYNSSACFDYQPMPNGLSKLILVMVQTRLRSIHVFHLAHLIF